MRNAATNYFEAIKKLVQRFYVVILLSMIILISLNYQILVENVVEDRQNIVSSYLALMLSLGFFLVVAIPIMSIYTRKRCPHCNKYVLRNVKVCNHCDKDIRISRDAD